MVTKPENYASIKMETSIPLQVFRMIKGKVDSGAGKSRSKLFIDQKDLMINSGLPYHK